MVLGLGSMELLVIIIAAFVMFGPERVPEASRQIGRWTAKVRAEVRDFKATLETEARDIQTAVERDVREVVEFEEPEGFHHDGPPPR